MYKEGDFILNAKDGRQYRTFDLSLEGEKIEGYAVVFEQPTLISEDPYTGTEFFEMISRNAFEGCDMSDVVLNVDHEGTPIARTRAGTLTLFIDQHGLKIEASLKTARGREVWEDVKAGTKCHSHLMSKRNPMTAVPGREPLKKLRNYGMYP